MEYKNKLEDSVLPENCRFCTIVKEGEEIIDNPKGDIVCIYTHFMLIANIYPYGEQHTMLIPKRHIHSLCDFNKEELEEFMFLDVELVGDYKWRFGSCFSFTREDTPRQTMWHWHKHFCVNDSFIPVMTERKEYAPLIELANGLNAE